MTESALKPGDNLMTTSVEPYWIPATNNGHRHVFECSR